MTTEDDFQAALDANPEDHHTRLVFADWLQDRDDPRAEGYRALGVLRKWPTGDRSRLWFRFNPPAGYRRHAAWSRCAVLPLCWLRAVCEELRTGGSYHPDGPDYVAYATRREAEDVAALAFARLPAARRAELLAGVVV